MNDQELASALRERIAPRYKTGSSLLEIVDSSASRLRDLSTQLRDVRADLHIAETLLRTLRHEKDVMDREREIRVKYVNYLCKQSDGQEKNLDYLRAELKACKESIALYQQTIDKLRTKPVPDIDDGPRDGEIASEWSNKIYPCSNPACNYVGPLDAFTYGQCYDPCPKCGGTRHCKTGRFIYRLEAWKFCPIISVKRFNRVQWHQPIT